MSRPVEAAPTVEFEIAAFDVAAPILLAWASEAPVHLLYGPDPIVAVDGPGRRGLLSDRVYSAVAWVPTGADAHRSGLLEAEIEFEERAVVDVDASRADLLATVVQKGERLPIGS